jgi:hypothetical protein
MLKSIVVGDRVQLALPPPGQSTRSKLKLPSASLCHQHSEFLKPPAAVVARALMSFQSRRICTYVCIVTRLSKLDTFLFQQKWLRQPDYQGSVWYHSGLPMQAPTRPAVSPSVQNIISNETVPGTMVIFYEFSIRSSINRVK